MALLKPSLYLVVGLNGGIAALTAGAAQAAAPQQEIIAADAAQPDSIAVADIDGDGIEDVLSTDPLIAALSQQGAIYWWRRQGSGSNVQWTRHVVSEQFYGAYYVDTADMDGDGDMDVIAAAQYGVTDPPLTIAPSERNGRYAWFENLDGRGQSWAQHTVGELFWGANAVVAADFDGDGDMDLAGSSSLTRGPYIQQSDITWFENRDGAGRTWTMHALDTDFTPLPAQVQSADLDGDGDPDLVATRWNEVVLWDNVDAANGQWSRRLIANNFYGTPFVQIGDMDKDGDPDIVAVAERDGLLRWWENIAGDGSIWQERFVAQFPSATILSLGDVDGDNDLDILASSYSTYSPRLGQAYWYENTAGDGSTWQPRLIKNFLQWKTWIAAGDIDNDGRADAVLMESDAQRTNEEQLSWYLLSSASGSAAPAAVKQQPTADAGADQTSAPQRIVRLDGSASRNADGGLLLRYQWVQTGGRSVPLYASTSARPSLYTGRQRTGTVQRLTFELTVTDDQGATSTDSVVVEIRS